MILENVSIGFGAPMVTSIDVELHAGELVCLIGKNGTGKSTLLKTIAGLIKPLAGEIIFSASHVSEVNIRSKSNSVAIVLTEFPSLLNTTVFEFVAYGRLPYINILSKLRKEDIAAVERAIKIVGITDLCNRRVSQLSDGERQKTMIAQVLAQGYNIILLDEPSAFLDYESKHELMRLLLSLAHNAGKSIILSTHDLDLAYNYADSIWKILDGKLSVKIPR